MKECVLELDGMSCGSCEKVIRGVAERNGAVVADIDAGKGRVALSCEEGSLEAIRRELAERGYHERAEERGDPSRAVGYLSAILAGEPHVRAESRLLNYSMGAAILILLAGSAAYAFLPGGALPNGYSHFLLLAGATSVISVISYRHMACYRRGLSCSNGMMVGMTLGMIGGFLVGAIVGATNGMFVGSVAGIGAGVVLGGNAGRFAGVMGALEGVMAALMSGLMGAMTAVMLFNDNLVAFMYILFGMGAFLLGGLSYMMHREAGAADETRTGGFAGFAAACLLMALAMALLMLFGPKAAITYG